jgi:hypothetical protein
MTAPEPPAGARLRVAMLTREYPPEVYGGAGVHVEYLARSLTATTPKDLRLWPTVPGISWPVPAQPCRSFLRTWR